MADTVERGGMRGAVLEVGRERESKDVGGGGQRHPEAEKKRI